MAKFDASAFLSAAEALVKQKAARPVTLDGLPPCWARTLTAGDILDAQDHAAALKAAGVEESRKMSIAVSLAQRLCGPSGEAIFNPRDPAHIAILSALPWESVRGLVSEDEPKN